MPSGLDETGASILSLDELLAHHKSLIEPFQSAYNPSISGNLSKNELSLLQLKYLIALRMLSNCNFCENRCGVNRKEDSRGKCRVGLSSYYASEFIHLGEEPEVIPSHTVFFTGCTFECLYCQNWDISHGEAALYDRGYPADESLVDKIIRRSSYVRNLNLVGGDPGQHLHTILNLLVNLNKKGYSKPIIWNSNLYATLETMDLLEGVIDVHLADFKYGSNEHGKALSGINGYWDIVTRNLLKAKGSSEIIIRHLVLPGHVDCCTSKVVDWVAENLPNASFNLMFQYHPEYRANEIPQINRYLTQSERESALKYAMSKGIAG